MRLATWNVNSIRVREQAVVQWLRRVEPDILCLQETKVVDDDFPTDEFTRLGYAVAMIGQPSYNGVAIAARRPLSDVTFGLLEEPDGAERRAIAATIDGIRVVSAYVPNGKAVGSTSFATKLAWLARLRNTLDARARPEQPLAVCGDFNVAFDDRDVFDPKGFENQLHCHPEERRALRDVLSFGLYDAFRHFHAEAGHYSWWDYRAGGFPRNQGLRIDYVFVTQALLGRCTRAYIDVEPRRADKPSDHAPVVVELD